MISMKIVFQDGQIIDAVRQVEISRNILLDCKNPARLKMTYPIYL